jgi:transcription elongation GreA/GreB family factor
MAFVLQGAAYTPTVLDVEAAVTIEPEGQGFRITRSALTNAAIKVDAKLISTQAPAGNRESVQAEL